MHIVFKLSVLIIICLLATACNNDIFVERVPDIVEDIYIDGIYGRRTLPIKRNKLVNIGIGDYYASDTQQHISYYRNDGTEIYNPTNFDDVSKIIYLTKLVCVELNLKEDEIEIVSLDNAYTDPLKIWLSLDYGYIVKYTSINIGIGKPYEIEDFGYYIDEYLTKTETVAGICETFHNNSPNTQKIVFYPYKDACSKITLTPELDDSWSENAAGIISIPYFKEGVWTIYHTEDVEATIGSSTSFNSNMVDINEEAFIEVAPNSSVSVQIFMTYAVLETGYNTIISMPNTEFIWQVRGRLTIKQPINYKIEKKQLDL